MSNGNKKGFFLTYGVPASDDHTGVGLKIRNQIDAFNKAGLQCGNLVVECNNDLKARIKHRIPFTDAGIQWKYCDELSTADYIYFRRPFIMTKGMRSFLQEAKSQNSKIKIVMELPTYPYDEEYKVRKYSWPIKAKDQFNRKRLQSLVDRIAILTDEKTVFGIPTLKIINGINVDAVHKRIPVTQTDSTIHICAVAIFTFWHGYERIIEGIDEYYKQGGTRNIICHFAGDGPELPFYKKLVAEKHLEEHCIFHGYIDGEDLDRLYNICTLSIGSLGSYKKNENYSCELKSREAVARGIPDIIGCPTDIYNRDRYPYYLEFPNDSSPIEIERVIEFNDKVYIKGQEKVINDIRTYAFKTVTMDKAMHEVINYFQF